VLVQQPLELCENFRHFGIVGRRGFRTQLPNPFIEGEGFHATTVGQDQRSDEYNEPCIDFGLEPEGFIAQVKSDLVLASFFPFQ